MSYAFSQQYKGRTSSDPDTYSFSNTFIIFSLALSVTVTWAIRWLLIHFVIPEYKDEQRKKRAAAAGEGKRWAGKGRLLDWVWFVYFLVHIPITLFLDCQSVLPTSIVPQPLKDFTAWYKIWSRDPIIVNAGTGSREWAWMDVFLHMELIVQVPCFILGAWLLWKNDKRAYPLALFYATTTTTTVIPTLYYLLTERNRLTPPLSTSEVASLLGSYLPFLIIPGVMIVDMFNKLGEVIRVAERAEIAEGVDVARYEDVGASASASSGKGKGVAVSGSKKRA